MVYLYKILKKSDNVYKVQYFIDNGIWGSTWVDSTESHGHRVGQKTIIFNSVKAAQQYISSEKQKQLESIKYNLEKNKPWIVI